MSKYRKSSLPIKSWRLLDELSRLKKTRMENRFFEKTLQQIQVGAKVAVQHGIPQNFGKRKGESSQALQNFGGVKSSFPMTKG